MKNILFIAPPAAGKGTQSNMFSRKYGVPHISTGDLLRKEISMNTDLGSRIQECMEQGHLVDDVIMLQLIAKRISMFDCKKGYILDGFPRTTKQAEAYDSILERLGTKLDVVILLDLSFEEASKRILGRLTCRECGSVYNTMMMSARPKVNGICDHCGGLLQERMDDTIETFKIRYDTYLKETKPLIEFYQKKGILYCVDSNNTPSAVFNEVEKIVIGND